LIAHTERAQAGQSGGPGLEFLLSFFVRFPNISFFFYLIWYIAVCRFSKNAKASHNE
jgi:hypothetical protein